MLRTHRADRERSSEGDRGCEKGGLERWGERKKLVERQASEREEKRGGQRENEADLPLP